MAARKVEGLLAAGARVTVVSPDARPRPGEAEGGEAASSTSTGSISTSTSRGTRSSSPPPTTQATNERVAADARRSGVLVNVVDEPALCDFIVPSVVRRGDVVLAISTGGLSPALARWLREELEAYLSEDFAPLAQLLAEVRGELRERGVTVEAEAWQGAIDGGLRDLVAPVGTTRRGRGCCRPWAWHLRPRILTARHNRHEEDRSGLAVPGHDQSEDGAGRGARALRLRRRRAAARPGGDCAGARPRRHPLDLQSHGALRRRAAASASLREARLDFLAAAKGSRPPSFDERFHFYRRGEAVHHLFRVTGGHRIAGAGRGGDTGAGALRLRRRDGGRLRRTPTWRGSSTPRSASGRRARSETASAATVCR